MFRGVIAPLATPFGFTGELRLDAFSRNLERYLETALSGFVVAGTTGEGLHLSDDEKLQLVEEARRLIPADRYLVAGIPAQSHAEAVRFAGRLAGGRLDGVLVSVPSYYRSRMTKASLCDYFSGLAEQMPFPVYLYNIPQLTGIELPVVAVQELSAHPNIAGMKESSGNLSYLQEVLAAVEGRQFQLMSGSGETFAFARQLGVEAAVLGASCIIPELLAQQAQRADKPDSEFSKVQSRIVLLSSVVTRGLGVPGIKCAMDLYGYEGLYCRRPLAPLSEVERERVREVLEQIDQR